MLAAKESAFDLVRALYDRFNAHEVKTLLAPAAFGDGDGKQLTAAVVRACHVGQRSGLPGPDESDRPTW